MWAIGSSAMGTRSSTGMGRLAILRLEATVPTLNWALRITRETGKRMSCKDTESTGTLQVLITQVNGKRESRRVRARCSTPTVPPTKAPGTITSCMVKASTLMQRVSAGKAYL